MDLDCRLVSGIGDDSNTGVFAELSEEVQTGTVDNIPLTRFQTGDLGLFVGDLQPSYLIDVRDTAPSKETGLLAARLIVFVALDDDAVFWLPQLQLVGAGTDEVGLSYVFEGRQLTDLLEEHSWISVREPRLP